MMLRAVPLVLGLVLLSGPARAQAQATVYCVNDRIMVDTATTIQQIRTRTANNAQICVIGPSFAFRPDGLAWVRNNLRAGEGDRCSCR